MVRAVRTTARVGPGGHVEIRDASLPEGAEAEVIVLVPEASGDGAPASPEAGTPLLPGGLPLVDEAGRPVFLPEPPARPRRPLAEILGSAPSGRTAAEIDRDLRALRDEWDDHA